MLYAHHVRDVLANAQQAQSPPGVRILQFRGLQLAQVARGVRYFLVEYKGLVHRQRHLVVQYEVVGRLGVKDLRIGESCHAVGVVLVGIVRKRLVTGQIYPCLCVLGKRHPRHVVQQGGDRLLQIRDLFRGDRLVFCLGQSHSKPLCFPVIVQHHRYHDDEQAQRYDGVHRIRFADRLLTRDHVCGQFFPWSKSKDNSHRDQDQNISEAAKPGNDPMHQHKDQENERTQNVGIHIAVHGR